MAFARAVAHGRRTTITGRATARDADNILEQGELIREFRLLTPAGVMGLPPDAHRNRMIIKAKMITNMITVSHWNSSTLIESSLPGTAGPGPRTT